MKKKLLIVSSTLAVLLAFAAMETGCTFKNEEEYYADKLCDTAAVTYSGHVKGIFETSCYNCHSQVTANIYGAGILFEGYDNLKLFIDDNPGRISGAIRHVVGFQAMPQGAPKLSDCDIAKIEKWIVAGYPNN